MHFINEYSDKCIIIFAGYEDLLKKSIFKVQPGLERRIGWTFNINPYNHSELASIYEKQLREKSWNINENHKLALRHSLVKATDISPSRSSANTINFLTGAIDFKTTTNSSSLELNSRFNDVVSNNFVLELLK